MHQLKVVICYHCRQHHKVICRPRPCFLPRQLPAEGIKANARQNTALVERLYEFRSFRGFFSFQIKSLCSSVFTFLYIPLYDHQADTSILTSVSSSSSALSSMYGAPELGMIWPQYWYQLFCQKLLWTTGREEYSIPSKKGTELQFGENKLFMATQPPVPSPFSISIIRYLASWDSPYLPPQSSQIRQRTKILLDTNQRSLPVNWLYVYQTRYFRAHRMMSFDPQYGAWFSLRHKMFRGLTQNTSLSSNVIVNHHLHFHAKDDSVWLTTWARLIISWHKISSAVVEWDKRFAQFSSQSLLFIVLKVAVIPVLERWFLAGAICSKNDEVGIGNGDPWSTPYFSRCSTTEL